MSKSTPGPWKASWSKYRDGVDIVQTQHLLDALRECEEYFDQRADAEYTTDSASPRTNEEMDMLVMIRDVLGKVGA